MFKNIPPRKTSEIWLHISLPWSQNHPTEGFEAGRLQRRLQECSWCLRGCLVAPVSGPGVFAPVEESHALGNEWNVIFCCFKRWPYTWCFFWIFLGFFLFFEVTYEQNEGYLKHLAKIQRLSALKHLNPFLLLRGWHAQTFHCMSMHEIWYQKIHPEGFLSFSSFVFFHQLDFLTSWDVRPI